MSRSMCVALLCAALFAAGCVKESAKQSRKRVAAGQTVSQNAQAPVPDAQTLQRLNSLGYRLAPIPGVDQPAVVEVAQAAPAASAVQTQLPAATARNVAWAPQVVAEEESTAITPAIYYPPIARLRFVSSANFPVDEVAAPRPGPSPLSTRPPRASTFRTVQGGTPGTITVTGVEMKPVMHSNLAFGVEGVIATFHVKEGDMVKKGQLLAELDTRVAAATVKAKEAELAAAQIQAANDAGVRDAKIVAAYSDSEYNRADRLYNNRAGQVISASEYGRCQVDSLRGHERLKQAEVDKSLAQATVTRLTAELDAAHKALAQRQIVAAFDGQVVRLNAAIGEWIKEKGVVEVADLTSLRLEGDVVDEQVVRFGLAPGAKVRISASGPDASGTYEGTLEHISPMVVAGKRRIVATVPNRVASRAGDSITWSLAPGADVGAEISPDGGILPAHYSPPNPQPMRPATQPVRRDQPPLRTPRPAVRQNEIVMNG